ncbi:N-acyl-L-homoserine lactone synthetase [Salinihabitans flavidus]|uniref:Acyl-homoserine-lactone synthase n=1 Tax=Salinihabitans flavidus TaxID=569882 RepID=A0A1H8VHD0_9RHOB|nr:acyl-homoserine-lactone synthase [Salinihabitans flavidus]SEP14821.1 N-acyl-L-homoserine lactone synthetase [Salinihabitans flavidus]
MLRYIYAQDLHNYPKLQRSMFRDRAEQFSHRLGWAVSVDEHGEERDEYDALNPLYVIWERADGRHGGSMRLLPTTGPCMVNDHFLHLTGGVRIESPLIWECTRFCLAPETDPRTAAALMLGGGEIMRCFGVKHYAGVFDARMVRIYRMIGSSPEVIGAEGRGRDRISVGLWSFTAEARRAVARRAGLSPEVSKLWFDRAFGRAPQPCMARSA